MCKCNKGISANKSPIVSGAFALENGNLRYSVDDFIVKYYIGNSGIYIGSSTGIDYGYRSYNAKTMVHFSDYEVDGNLFSDTEQSSELINEKVLRSSSAESNNEILEKQLDVLTAQINEYEESQIPAEFVTFEENVDKKETLVKPKKESKKKEMKDNAEIENNV